MYEFMANGSLKDHLHGMLAFNSLIYPTLLQIFDRHLSPFTSINFSKKFDKQFFVIY